MQLRSPTQKYTEVQIIYICKIYTPCVYQRACELGFREIKYPAKTVFPFLPKILC